MIQLKDPGPIEFKGKIKQTEMRNNTALWVDFPYDLKETYGKGNLVPVIVTFNDKVKYQGSLAKMGSPKAMILLRKDVQEQLGEPKAGDVLKVKVDLDAKKREITLAQDEKIALQKANLLEKFQQLPYTHQREYHQWVEEAKKPQTRTRRIQQMIERLT